ncbi:MAG: hypothetical protein A2096_04455 [Spirochaetes bacterium GWF1_41_5]|nr:MAG: hypothetical protein A2096_04455 [Spirochaetes bacterium GWF1_41_5]
MRLFFFITASLFLLCAEESSFDLPADNTASPGLEITGSLESVYSLLHMQKKSPLYALQYSGTGNKDVLSSFGLNLYLNGEYNGKYTAVYLKTFTEYFYKNIPDFAIFELYGSFDITDNIFLYTGKKMFNWGKGYAFNPVGYINPRKDSDNPELAHEGKLCIGLQFTKSFARALDTITFDAVILPSVKLAKKKYAYLEHTDAAARFYLLLFDTDIDLYGYYSTSGPLKAGIDFSLNLLPSLELHGEANYFRKQKKIIINNFLPEEKTVNGFSGLGGVRFLSPWNMTVIAEYYHNESGFSEDEFNHYSRFLSLAARQPGTILNQAAAEFNNSFSGNIMRDYLYLKITQQEPFKMLYTSISGYGIFCINNQDILWGCQISVKPAENFELRLDYTSTAGKNGEFYLKPFRNKLEARAVFNF